MKEINASSKKGFPPKSEANFQDFSTSELFQRFVLPYQLSTITVFSNNTDMEQKKTLQLEEPYLLNRRGVKSEKISKIHLLWKLGLENPTTLRNLCNLVLIANNPLYVSLSNKLVSKKHSWTIAFCSGHVSIYFWPASVDFIHRS